jgi:ubiquinone/menaquinone biosynthesis C-methylase UbiE
MTRSEPRSPEPLDRPPKLEVYRNADVASEYDRRWASSIGKKRDQRKAKALVKSLDFLEQITSTPVESILDLPCGTGRFSSLLGDRHQVYLGADFSLEMLREAQVKLPRFFLAADCATLPMEDRSVDACACVRFLHLVRDPEIRIRFLSELARVSRLGVIVDYRHDRTFRIWGKRLRHRMGLLELAPSNPSPGQIRSELAAAGLKPHTFIKVHRAPFLSDKILVVCTP